MRHWRTRGPLAWLLLPLGLLFFLLAAVRRLLYRGGILGSERLPVPVVVVGNIVAGGAGKTPLVVWLAGALRRLGRRPGIVSRGHGRAGDEILEVGVRDTAAEVGDEPLLLARRTGCPVFVGRDRVAAGRALLAAHPQVDVILADDGLQHYRLARDVEIALVDRRGLMNGWPLPAGPLREPAARLAAVDAVVAHGWEGKAAFRMALEGHAFHRLGAPTLFAGPVDLGGKKLHAVAGIGDPRRFFDHLAALGIACETHAFPDHHAYVRAELDFAGDAILTTEKDAVKFPPDLALPVWVLPVAARVEPDLAQFVVEKINGCPPA